MSPLVGSISFSKRRINVDLPEPEEPTTKTNSPLLISRDTSLKPTAPFSYIFVTFSILIKVKTSFLKREN